MITIRQLKGGETVVSVSFTSDDVVNKPGLEKNVIEQHLLRQATVILTEASQLVISGVDEAALDAEAAEAKAKIDEEIAKRKLAVTIDSDVEANEKTKDEII